METTEINQNQVPIVNQPVNNGTSQDTRTLVTVLLLIFAFPVGVIVLFFWSKWPVWVKLLVSLPLTILVLAVMSVALLSVINPPKQVNMVKDATSKFSASELSNAMERYYSANNAYPWGNSVGYKSSDLLNESWITKVVEAGELKNENIEKFKRENTVYSLNQTGKGVEVCFESIVQKSEVCVPE